VLDRASGSPRQQAFYRPDKRKGAWIREFAGFAVEKSVYIRVHSWLNVFVSFAFSCGKQSAPGNV
jgi:hypothetical protein